MRLRISKYDPTNRRSDGTYDRNEWTSYSELGKEFVDGILTLDSYTEVENKYVLAVRSFFERAGISRFLIDEVELGNEEIESVAVNGSLHLVAGSYLPLDQLECVIRMSLREEVWCKLSGAHQSYLHFGYDYYVYVGSADDSLIEWQPPPGIYAELFASPYL